MLHRYKDPGLKILALCSWQPLKWQRAPLAREDACVRRCVFNQYNICFLRSFPAAINCWLSLGFDKSPGGGVEEDERTVKEIESVKPNGVLHIFWKITSMTDAYTEPLKFAGGDIHRPQRERVLLHRLLADFEKRLKKNNKAFSLINFSQTHNV